MKYKVTKERSQKLEFQEKVNIEFYFKYIKIIKLWNLPKEVHETKIILYVKMEELIFPT